MFLILGSRREAYGKFDIEETHFKVCGLSVQLRGV